MDRQHYMDYLVIAISSIILDWWPILGLFSSVGMKSKFNTNRIGGVNSIITLLESIASFLTTNTLSLLWCQVA